MQKTKVSACIVVYGGGEEAAQAARSLVEHTRDAALSLTLVDNASPDGGGRMACGAAAWPRSEGGAPARERGLRQRA